MSEERKKGSSNATVMVCDGKPLETVRKQARADPILAFADIFLHICEEDIRKELRTTRVEYGDIVQVLKHSITDVMVNNLDLVIRATGSAGAKEYLTHLKIECLRLLDHIAGDKEEEGDDADSDDGPAPLGEREQDVAPKGILGRPEANPGENGDRFEPRPYN